MIDRRQLLEGGLMGGVVGAFAGGGSAQRGDGREAAEVVKAIDDLREEFRRQRQFTEIASIREAQLVFLRANNKLPDYIEVGADLWFAAYDWHVRWQQPLTISRDATGRTTLLLLATQLVLRPDAQGNFMSLPYDNRA
jgi:hypothetical protein